MNLAATVVKHYFDSKEIRSEFLGDNNEAISVGISGDNSDSIDIIFLFGDDNTDVTVKVFEVCSFPPEQKEKMYEACSKINGKFRWVKFYVDEEDICITAELDAVIQLDSCGEECYELLMRMANIVDDAYPEFMKIRWA